MSLQRRNPISTYIGIDPGLSGAIAFLRYKSVVAIHPMPLRRYSATRDEPDTKALFDLLKAYGKVECVGIEQVSVQKVFGASSSFTFGRAFQAVLSAVEIACLPHVRIQPKEWKKTILIGTDQSKEAAIGFVKRMYPGVDLIPPGESKDSHDFAEAVCLAKYAQKVK